MFGNSGRKALGPWSLLLGLALMLSALPTAAAPKPTIHLVTYQDPPFSYMENDGVTGIVVEYARELVMRAGFEYSIEMAPAKRALILANMQPDTCVFPIERSQEREVQYKWVSPILISRYGLYGRPDDDYDIFVLNDAKNFTIGSSFGSSMGEYLESLGFVVDYAPNNEANVHKLFLKRIDLWASDTLSAPFLAEVNGFKLGQPQLEFFTTLRAMGCNTAMPDAHIDALSDTLMQMYRDGSIGSRPR